MTAIHTLRARAFTDDDAFQVLADHLLEHDEHAAHVLHVTRRLVELGRVVGFKVKVAWDDGFDILVSMPVTGTPGISGMYRLRVEPGAESFSRCVDWGPNLREGHSQRTSTQTTYDGHMSVILRGKPMVYGKTHITLAAVAAWALCTMSQNVKV